MIAEAPASSRPFDPQRLVAPAVAIGAAAVFGLLLAVALSLSPPSWTTVFTVGIGLVVVLAIALAWLDAAVLLGLFLLPFVRIEPAPTDLVFGVAIAVSLLTGRFTLQRVPASIFFIVGSFLALNLLSAMDAVNFSLAARYGLITLYLIVFAFWLTSYLNSPERARVIVRGYVYTAAVVAVLAVAAVNADFPGADLLRDGTDYRALGPFKDPNVFGHFLIPAMLLALHEFVAPRLLPARPMLNAALVASMAIGIFFSYSRSAWAGAIVGTLTMFLIVVLRRGGIRRAAPFVALIVIAAGAVAAAVAVTGAVEFISQRARFQAYDTDRFAAQREGIRVVADHPFGIGPGQFEEVLRYAAHSSYVRALTENGFIGLGLIVGLMLVTLLLATRNVFGGRQTFGIGSAPLLGSWVAILGASTVIDTIHWRHFWLVAALIWAATMRGALTTQR